MTDTLVTGDPLVHDPEAKRKVVNRLKRAQGQLAAVITAVEDDAHCRDVVQQLSAVSKALDRAGFLVISTALRECLTDPDADDVTSPAELEKLFLSRPEPVRPAPRGPRLVTWEEFDDSRVEHR